MQVVDGSKRFLWLFYDTADRQSASNAPMKRIVKLCGAEGSIAALEVNLSAPVVV